MVLWGALIAGVPTVGVLASCLVSVIPLVVAQAIAPDNDAVGIGAVALGAVAWVVAAATVAMGSLRLAGRIGRVRVRRGTVAVGADGLRWRDLLRARFVSWAEVEAVRVVDEPERVVVLELRDGSTRELGVGEIEELHAAATNALERWQAREAAGEVRGLRLEARGELRGWLDRAKTLLASTSYREESVAPEQLVRVAEDPKAAPEQRIGAALALSRAPEPLRVRVRVASEDTADPALAEALGEAIEGKLRARTAARAIGRETRHS